MVHRRKTKGRGLLNPQLTRCRIAAVALLAAVAASCGGGSPAAPVTPTAAPSTPATPPPTGGGVNQSSCPLGNGSPNATCEKTSSKLSEHVTAAMDLLLKEKPQLFDLNDQAAPVGYGNYKVLDKQAYLDGLVSRLQAAGLCAQRDPDDFNYEQINVKKENEYSEDFDVLTGSGHMWRSGTAYRRTCTPASFPVDRSDLPPAGSGCGAPYPPPVHHFNSKVHVKGSDYDLLDSTPYVGPDAYYCSLVGFTDRIYCPVRHEGSPERIPCETWRVGYAKDTGRPGPTWTLDGQLCTGKESGCENFEDHQYGLKAYRPGTYRMCGQNGACGQLVVD